MTLNYNVSGTDRKSLVHAIRSIMEAPAKYLGAPSFAYKVGDFTVDKNGCVSFDDHADSGEVEYLIERLYEMGFTAEGNEPDEERLTISLPKAQFTDTAIANLRSLLKSKGTLIKKALGVNDLSVLEGEEAVSFPWFAGERSAEDINAYSEFICKLCKMAANQKRINAKGKEVDNEKYAFRCFLLRLGFIGDEYKTARKILLRNLTGSSAFKGGASDAVSE